MADPYKYINSGRYGLFNNLYKTCVQYTDTALNIFGPSFSQENVNFSEPLPTGNKEFWIKDKICFSIIPHSGFINYTSTLISYITDTNNTRLYYISSIAQVNKLLGFYSKSNYITINYEHIVVADNTYGTRGALLYPTGTTNNGHDLYSDYTDGVNTTKIKTNNSCTNEIAVYKNDTKISDVFLVNTGEQINFELHVKSDVTNGIVELFINSKLVFTYTGEVLNGEDISSFYIGGSYKDTAELALLSSPWTYYPLMPIHSSIIVQNTGVIGNKEVIELPIKDTTTTWVLQGDGTYLTNDSNSTLLQSIDYDTLKNNITSIYGAKNNISIMGISVQSEHSYYNRDSNLKSTDFIMSKNNIITTVNPVELGYIKSFPLIVSPVETNPITSKEWDIKDLENISFGFKISV